MFVLNTYLGVFFTIALFVWVQKTILCRFNSTQWIQQFTSGQWGEIRGQEVCVLPSCVTTMPLLKHWNLIVCAILNCNFFSGLLSQKSVESGVLSVPAKQDLFYRPCQPEPVPVLSSAKVPGSWHVQRWSVIALDSCIMCCCCFLKVSWIYAIFTWLWLQLRRGRRRAAP